MCESFESVPCRACLQFCSSMFADVYYMPSQTTAEAKVSQVKSIQEKKTRPSELPRRDRRVPRFYLTRHVVPRPAEEGSSRRGQRERPGMEADQDEAR